ncbi:hypothetical protein [Larkinella harenae]
MKTSKKPVGQAGFFVGQVPVRLRAEGRAEWAAHFGSAPRLVGWRLKRLGTKYLGSVANKAPNNGKSPLILLYPAILPFIPASAYSAISPHLRYKRPVLFRYF